MSAEQGDVERQLDLNRIRNAIRDPRPNLIDANAALDRLAVALERAERERDEANELVGEDAGSYLFNMKARAEKAELALAENEQAWEDMRAYNIRLEERAREAERTLAELLEALRRIAEGDPPEDAELWWTGKSWRIELARAALRPEDRKAAFCCPNTKASAPPPGAAGLDGLGES